MIPLGVELVCAIEVDRDNLRISYTLQNGGDVELGAFSHIDPSTDDRGDRLPRSPDVAYVELENGTLTISKRVPVVPPGLYPAVRAVPLVSRVPAGGWLAEIFTLPIPVRVWHPFHDVLLSMKNPDAEVRADRPAQAGEVRFALGIFPIDDELRLTSAQDLSPGAFSVVPPGLAAAREIVLEHRQRLPVPLSVLDYRLV